MSTLTAQVKQDIIDYVERNGIDRLDYDDIADMITEAFPDIDTNRDAFWEFMDDNGWFDPDWCEPVKENEQ
jgi:hypothetical protein